MSQAEALDPANISDRDHIRGSSDAPVTIIQYGDFECFSCRDVYPILKRIQDRIGTRFQVVFRHFPLSEQHHHAQKAAEATEAAAQQDEDKFWQMYDLLYTSQKALTTKVLQGYAADIELDVERFEKELDEGKYKDRVEEDVKAAKQNGVSRTPTFFINGQLYDGSLEYKSLLAAIAEAGEFTDILQSLDVEHRKIRETIDKSHEGAPAAGKAIRDRFSVDEIYRRVTATANEEIDRNARLLFFSGLAAGTALGATFFGRSVMMAAYPDSPLLGSLFYPIGFIMIALGGYQLFTENTITPVTLVLTRLASIPKLLRFWGIVLIGNIVSVTAVAFTFAHTGIFDASVAETARGFAEHALSFSWQDLFFRAIVAGGLIATMVWLIHAARDTTTRFFVVYIITFLIPVGDLFHCITGSCEVLYLAFTSSTTLFEVFADFFIPVVLGNIVGGVFFVTIINYGMTAERKISKSKFKSKLSLWEWLFGNRISQFIMGKKKEKM